jgi:hypothetical protein
MLCSSDTCSPYFQGKVYSGLFVRLDILNLMRKAKPTFNLYNYRLSTSNFYYV